MKDNEKLKTIHKKTPMIHLDGEELFASPQWFSSIYTPTESLLISHILYKTQIYGGVCKITESELSLICRVSTYPIKVLKKRISSDKNFTPFLSFSINENDRRGGVFFKLDKEKFIDFKEKTKKLYSMEHTNKQDDPYQLKVSNLPIKGMEHTNKQDDPYQTPYKGTRARSERFRKKEKEYPQTPLEGDECVSDFSNNQKKVKTKSEKPVSRFPEWYAVYPRKVAVEAARKAFIKIEQTFPDQIQDIIDRTKCYAQKVMGDKTDPKFIAHPATWLSGHRWDDEDLKNLKPPDKPLTEEERKMNLLKELWLEEYGTMEGFEERHKSK